MVVVKYKYAPIAAACLSLCTGVAASAIAKRQFDEGLAGIDLGLANGALGSTSPSSTSSSGDSDSKRERAVSNRATAAAADSSPAFVFGGTGNVPGTTNENRAVVALTPGTTVAYDGVNGLTISQLASTGDLLTALVTALLALTGITTAAAPLPEPASSTLSSTIATGAATLGTIVTAAPNLALPDTTSVVPASVTSLLSPLLSILGPLLGGTGVSPTDPLSSVNAVVAILMALVPVLTNLAGSVSAVGL